MGKTIYIVLTDTGTVLSKMIGMYTRKDFNHASIAFDEQLTEVYSFGRKYQSNPFIAGFVKENVAEGIFRDASCAVLSWKVSESEFERIRFKIRHIEQNKEQYRFNFIGLFGVAVNKGIDRERAYFCSQFVATVLNESDLPMFSVSPSLVQPHHFSKIKCFNHVYEGDLHSYLDMARGREERRTAHMSGWKSLVFRILA
ncbi:hypothetical protein [Sporosarcina sp. FA9]|uniref:hypothetical protein n=1 Tax=Sporosarcina sp. FA9 TaxID=3413030 RepID=UPI003F65E421